MAKAQRRQSVKLVGVMRRKRAALLVSTALQATAMVVISIPGLALAQPAPNAQPTGGAVVAGAARISQSPAQTTIDQSSNRAALTWQSYNVGSQQRVLYNQPSSSSVTLNRVTGPDPSQIAGRIDANGQIVLMNQAGVVFYKGAQVNTNGLMVTATSMSDGAMKSFVNGGAMVFDKAANPNAQVVNGGNITIKQAGLAALVAPEVRNSGTIDARLGKVVLAGGTQIAALDMYGDGLLSIDVTGQVVQAPVGPDGKPVTALVTNTGVIRADGGVVQLTARAADGVVSNLVDAGGKIQANTVNGKTGVVAINGIGGGIVIQGQISAVGRQPGSTGGDIEANATGNVTVASRARINASGRAGGGNVAIGTTLARAKGGPSVTPTLTAAGVDVQPGAVVRADATQKGNGGRVTVLSTKSTRMAGTISAKGGPQGGDGGFVEVSGESGYSLTGPVDVSAALGNAGTILIDPYNLTIQSGGTNGTLISGGTLDFGAGGTAATGDDAVIDPGVLTSLTGTIDLQAFNDLTVSSAVNASSASQLTMRAGHNLTINAGVTSAGGLTLTAADTSINPGGGGGSLSINANIAGSNISLSGGTGGIALAANVNSGSGTLSMISGGTIAQNSGSITAGTLVGTAAGSVSLLGSNAVNALGNFSVASGGFALMNSIALNVNGTVSVAGGNEVLWLQAPTIMVAGTGSLAASGSNQEIALLADSFSNSGSINASGGDFFLAPIGTETMTLGATGSGLSLPSFAGITAGNALLGVQVHPGAVLDAYGRASAVTIAGTFDASAEGALQIYANGAVTQSKPLIGVNALAIQAGTVTLLDPGNVIHALDYSSAGNFALRDSVALAVNGADGASGNMFIDAAGGISVNASLTATGTLGLMTDSLALNAGGTIIANTLELAPHTPGSLVSLGAAGGLSLANLAGISASTLRIGEVTDLVNGPTITAGTISVGGAFGSSSVALDLHSTGSIAIASPLTASGLTATAGTGHSIFLNSAGTVVQTSGGGQTYNSNVVLLADSEVADTGNGAIDFARKVDGSTAGGQNLTVDAGSGITTFGSAVGNSTPLHSVAVTGSGTVQLSDNVSTKGGGQSYAGPITLLSSVILADSAGGSLMLNGQVSGSDSLTLTTSGAETLSGVATGAALVLGTPSALTLNGGTYTVSGNNYAFPDVPTTLKGTLTLNQRTTFKGAITLGGDTTVDSSGGGLLTFDRTIDGTSSNSQSLTVTAGTNTATFNGDIGGTIPLANVSVNAGIFSMAAGKEIAAFGTITLDQTQAGAALTLPGTLQDAAVVDLISQGAIIGTASTIATGGTLIGSAAGNVSLTQANTIGTLGSFAVTGGNFTLTNAGTLSVTGPLTAADIALTTSAGDLLFAGDATATGTMALVSAGAIKQSAGTIGAGTLTGSAVNGFHVNASNSNHFTTIGSFAGGPEFFLNLRNGVTIAGPLTATNVQIFNSGNSLIDVTGSVGAGGEINLFSQGTVAVETNGILNSPLVTLSGAGDVLLNGSASIGQSAGVVELSSTSGNVIEASTATITAGTLQSPSSVNGNADLLGSNAIDVVKGFAAGGNFTLNDGTPLLVGGTVSAGATGTLRLATTGSLAIGNAGTVGVLSAGTVALNAGGTLSEDANNGSIHATVLTGSAAAVSLTGSNLIGTLAAFTSGDSLLLNDGTSLAVLGGVTAGSSGTLALTVAGNLGIGNSGTAGVLNAGTVALLATGTISEDPNHGTIIASVLNGPNVAASAAAAATLISAANGIDTLGTFLTTGDFQLVDSKSLTLAGRVAPTAGSIFIETAAGKTLTFNGGSLDVSASNGTIGLVSDGVGLSGAGTIIAGTGTVEIAPRSATSVSLSGGSGGLAVSSALLGSIAAGELRIGGYHDATNSGSNVINATSIDIAGAVSLTAVSRLRLDTNNGAVTESGGPLSVGTLVGVANGYTLTNASNSIGTLGAVGAGGTLTATGGNIWILDAAPLAVQNAVSALNGNIFLREGTGQALSLLNGGSIIVGGGTIGLVADQFALASGASIVASGAGGLVEIAPATPGSIVSLAGATGLSLSNAALDAITAAELRIGGYHDQVNGNANVVTAGSLDIAGAVSLGAALPLLRLDTIGPITESAGALSVGTLSISTNGSLGDVTLGGANVVNTLDDVTVAGGAFSFNDGAGTLTLPQNAVIYGTTVAITNSGSVIVLGDLGSSVGGLSLTGSNLTIGDGSGIALIGATGAATLTATTGAVTQVSGLINGNGVTIGAATNFIQSGGTIINVATSGGSLVVNAGSIQQTALSATMASNDDVTLTGTNGISTSGTILGVGTVALVTDQGFTQNSGLIAAGGDLLLHGRASATTAIGGNIAQNGGTLSSGSTAGDGHGVILLGNFTSTDASQSATARVDGYTIEITSATGSTAFQHFGAGNAVNLGGNLAVTCTCSGLSTQLVNTSPVAPGTTPSLASIGAATGSQPHHLILDVIDQTAPSLGTYTFNTPLTADWVEIHTSGSLVQQAGGTITATLLTGSAGYQATGSGPLYTFTTPFGVTSDALLNGVTNAVANLGNFLATGDFKLNNGPALTVVGSVVAGGGNGGHVLALTTPSLTIDQSGNASTVNNVAIVANGSLSAGAAISSGSVTPGRILLQTDTLAVLGSGIAINAPDGMVGIAPLSGSITTIALGGGGNSSTLLLTQALLNTINTLGSSGGTSGTQTLMLGSLDGATPGVATIDINSGIALTGITRNLALLATGSVAEIGTGSLTVTSLSGSVTSGGVTLNGSNAIAELGNVGTRIVAGTTYVTVGSYGSALQNLTAGGDVRLNDTGLASTGTLGVVGAVTANAAAANASGTIALSAPAILIQTGGTMALANGTIPNAAAGSLLAVAGPVSAGTLTPSRISLQTDSLGIRSSGTTPIVRAPSGQVAIAPLTAGRGISIDAVGTLGGPTLSLGTTDLALIDTLSGTLALQTPGPVGTQTLSLGSVDDGATVTAGSIVINTPVTLGSTNFTANTLALYTNGGDVTEPAGSVSVDTLIGTATNGNIYLNGANILAHLGNLPTRAGITTPGAVNANLVASGNILIHNTHTLDVVTNVQGGSGASNYAEIDVLSANSGSLSVLNGGTVQAGSVYLRAGDNTTAGGVTIASGGSVLALAANGEADLVAGVAYTAATPTQAPSNAYPQGATNGGSIQVSGVVDAGNTGTVGLFAGANIDEPGSIHAGLLRGFSETGYAYLPGSTGSTIKTTNQIANLGFFVTANGLRLRDGESLKVVGPVSDSSTNGVTLAVAPTGGGPNGFGVGDLVVAGGITAGTGAVDLEATGNVYETTGGNITALHFTSQAGVIPGTENGGNTAGTIPTTTFGSAIDWFGNANLIANLDAITATGNFLLYDAQSLNVTGNVIAGTQTSGVLSTAYTVVNGPFGTTPASTPAPFGEIDVIGGGGLLTVTGNIHVGLDATLTGNVTLRAGNSTNAGSIDVQGGVYAANGGVINVSAGYDPNLSGFAAYDTACAGACGITLSGILWGDQTGGSPALASLVSLNAASSIDETVAAAKIGATTLTGFAGGHANLSETAFSGGSFAQATAGSGNDIVNLGSFTTNPAGFGSAGGSDDVQGFFLRDGAALTVNGPVSDGGASASRGISIAVVPGGYAAGDLTLHGNVSAATTSGGVVLQATGDVLQTSGSISARNLSAEAGMIPGTEATGSQPGTIGTAVLSTGSIVLTDANQIGSVSGTGTIVGMSAQGGIKLTNTPSLLVSGTIVSQSGSILLNNTQDLTNGGLIHAVNQDVSLVSAGNITNNQSVIAQQNAYLNAGGNISNGGLVHAISQDASLVAGLNVTNNGTVWAGRHVIGTSGTVGASNGSIFDNALIQADGSGLVTDPSVKLTALNGGSIVVAGTGTVTATAATAAIEMNASADIDTAGQILATGNQGLIGLTATNAIDQTGGSIIAGGPATTVSGSIVPSITLLAQTGTIAQSGNILATNNAGTISITAAASSIATSGSIIAAGSSAYVGLTAGTSITQSGGTILSGGHGLIPATGAVTPNLALTAHNGSITQSAGVISAPNASGVIALNATGDISFAGSILAPGVITGGTIPAAGTSAGVSLVSTAGAISETGPNAVLQAGMLRGASANGVALTSTSGTGNLVADLGAFPANSVAGSFVLTDDQNLSVVAPVSSGSGSVTITASHRTGGPSNLTNNSTIQAQAGVTLSADANLTNNGSVLALGNDATLTAGSGTLLNSGGHLISAAHDVVLSAGADIINGVGATITAGHDARLTAAANLTNNGSVRALGNDATLTATGGTLSNGAGALISAAHDALLSAGADIINGTGATITAGHDARLTATANLTNSGSVLALGNDATLTATGGTLQNSGGQLISAAHDALLSAGADIVNGAGATIAAGHNAQLTAGANISNAAAAVVNAGNLAILSAGGAISNTGGTIAAAGAGSIGSPSVALVAHGGSIASTNGGTIMASAATGVAALSASGDVILDGLLAAPGSAGYVLVTAGGSVNQNGGTVVAGAPGSSATPSIRVNANTGTIGQAANATMLASNASGAIALNAHSGATLNGVVNGNSSVAIVTGGSLSIPGAVSAHEISLDADSIGIPGLVSAGLGGTLNMVTNAGGITEGGTLIAGTLSGSAPGAVTLTGGSATTNQVAQITNFTAGTTFALNDAINLLLSGTLNAPQIDINDNTSTFTFGDGATIVTSGIVRPTGTIAVLPPLALTTKGAYITAGNFTQLGDSTVLGAPSILRIDSSGSISFNPSGSLRATSTWVILDLTGNGQITGSIHVADLDVAFAGNNASATLTGSVHGFTGQAAAGVAFIQPHTNAHFHVNSCPIHSVNCVLLPSIGLPSANPLDEIFIGSFFNPDDEGDLLLPIVSDQDY